MKPLKLKMKNFGPYKDEEVDFTKFSETPLFLITGDTGSGKTTIFDAMCFALYGQSSTGKDRNGLLLRSDFVKDPKEKTEVELKFSHQGKEYYVMRCFYESQSTVVKKADFKYQDADGNVEELTKLKEIGTKIESLLHLNAEQFRKIILLPQGKFQEFLMSDSNEKEKVLSQIFGTDFYDDWVSEIKKQADEARTDSDEIKKELSFEQRQAVFSETEPESEPIADWFDALDLQIRSDEEKFTKARETEEETQKKVNESLKKMTLDEQLEQDFQEFESVGRKMKFLEQARPGIKSQADYLAELNWALGCETMVFKKKSSRKRLEELKADIEKQNSEFFGTKEKLVKALEIQQSLLKKASKREKAQADFNLWQGRVGIYDETEQRRAELAELQAQADKSAKKLNDKKASLEQKAVSQKALSDFIEKSSSSADEKHRLELELQKLAENEKTLQECKAQNRELETLKSEKDTLAKEYAEAAELQRKAEQNYENIQSQWARLQINELARLLKPGEACPVCGSLEHPNPAFDNERNVSVTESQVKSAKKRHDESVARASEKKARTDAKTKELSERTAVFVKKITAFSQELGDDAIEISVLEENLDARRAENEGKLAQAREMVQKRNEAEVQLRTLQSEIEREKELVSVLKQELSELQAKISGRNAGLAELEKQLPKQFKSKKELQEQLNQWNEFVQEYDDDKSRNDEEVSELERKRASMKALIEKEDDDLRNEIKNLQDYEREIESICLKKGIAVRRLYDLLGEKNRIAEIEREISDFQKKEATVSGEYAARKKKIDGKIRPEIEEMKQMQRDEQKRHERAKELLQHADNQLRKNRECRKKAKKVWKNCRKKLALAERKQSLYNVLHGQKGIAPGFSRFVLANYLRNVIEVANVHLDKLTDGRYNLILDDEAKANVKNMGLELDIYDDNAGVNRPVHTLSGGERFIFSLSLALALGEIIQERNGGISIEAMFIDEGFGTLDGETLQTVLDALQSLENNDRMIGIISHVDKFKEQIPAQIRVTSRDGISTIDYQTEF
ncbi:AAA family ATPase [Ligilactobacillus sp.]|uniref:AAA family ATPase n=1 Tax=Ligilactobacillus sp. TaxID=2767921 RepID=UPI002FE00562